mgnify:CR=1
MRSEQDDASSFRWDRSIDARNEIVSTRLDGLAPAGDAVAGEKRLEVFGESAFPIFGP